jgi:guanylate kinase
MNAVLERVQDLKQLPTATTRRIRPSERDGREHLFITRGEFQHMIDNDTLIEHQLVHGELYGVPRAAVEQAVSSGQDLIADIEVLGAAELRRIYPENAILIFIQPPSISDLEARMRTRGETEAEIAKRMKRVNMEMDFAPSCDYLITNEDLNSASEILYGIVLAERSRRALWNLRLERAELENAGEM